MRWVLACLGSGIVIALWYLKNKINGELVAKEFFSLTNIRLFGANSLWIGLAIMRLPLIDFNHPRHYAQRLIMGEIWGDKQASIYQYFYYSMCLTYGVFIIFIACILGAIMNDLFIFIFGLIVTVIPWFYVKYTLAAKIRSRRVEIERDLGRMMFTFTLLMQAGLVIRLVWEKVAFQGGGILYTEMRRVLVSLDNGENEQAALNKFAERCRIQEVRQFTLIVSQNLEKGSLECVKSLKEFSLVLWEKQKTKAERKGELASQKMLIPLTLLFVGILIIIVVPMWSNL